MEHFSGRAGLLSGPAENRMLCLRVRSESAPAATKVDRALTCRKNKNPFPAFKPPKGWDTGCIFPGPPDNDRVSPTRNAPAAKRQSLASRTCSATNWARYPRRGSVTQTISLVESKPASVEKINSTKLPKTESKSERICKA